MEVARARRLRRKLKVKFGDAQAEHLGFLEDISATGMRLNSNKSYQPGTTIKMCIYDDISKTDMYAEGYVAWADKRRYSLLRSPKKLMGIRFLQTSPLLKSYFIRMGNSRIH